MSNIKSLGDINKLQRFVDVVADYDKNIIFLSSEGKLYQTSPKNYHEKQKALENLPPMKSIASGYFHFLVISNEEKPRVYGWGESEHQLGFEFNSSVEKPTLIESLKEKNIDQICCSGYCSFFINKTTNILFGCGKTKNGSWENQKLQKIL
ncbi:regulator of chromosome condensation [Anaeramoeba flamelloides]|uniref:Regulator of chromosome condensation n=1 Tax=Anaeramoeba flamelloides TaxID=1746091 RepID=A0AAV8A6P8_9EUKA|nr:regulator of chromosome condensation [Anaeramoeba flamelloides]